MSANEQELLAKFYPEHATSAAPQRPEPPPATPPATPPSRENVEPPAEPVETTDAIDEAELAERLYGDPAERVSSYTPSLSDSFDRLTDLTGMSVEQRTGAMQETVEVFTDAQIPAEPAARLHALMVAHVANPADDATVERWATEAREALRERYGHAEAERRLDAARTFVKNRPELQRLLDVTGLGSHPEVVRALAENPHGLRLVPRKRKA